MTEFAVVAAITILAVISPGPDFVMVSRNSLALSRQAGMLTATGIGIGVLVHVTYTIVGVGFLLQSSPSLFFCFKMAGAAYLVWMGGTMLFSKSHEIIQAQADYVSTNIAALRMGIFTNALNPKTSVFILSLFMQVVSPDAELSKLIFYGVFIAITHVVWFLLVAYFLSADRVRDKVFSIRIWIDRCFGSLLVCFGVALANMAVQ